MQGDAVEYYYRYDLPIKQYDGKTSFVHAESRNSVVRVS